MRAMSPTAGQRSTETVRPDGRATDQTVENVLADIAYTLWPKNTAPNLATAADCEVRSAERYLEGSRAWSGDAIAAIVAEIMRRHHMRNFKVIAKR